MKIDKIEIKTSNKKYATDIAMLVDKPDFLNEMQRLRTKWNITELLDTAEMYDGFLEKYLAMDDGRITDKTEIQKRSSEFNADIDGILKKFHRDRNFKNIVEYALATGIIADHIYRRCYFDKVMIGEPEDLSKPERYQYVIIMSPRTEKKEVEKAYDEFQTFIRGYKPKATDNPEEGESSGKIDWQKTEGAEDFFEYEDTIKGTVYDTADITKFKTMSKQLERTREWYWMRYGDNFNDKSKKPVPYAEIYLQWQDKCPTHNEHENETDRSNCIYCSVDHWNDVEKALIAYKKLLEKS